MRRRRDFSEWGEGRRMCLKSGVCMGMGQAQRSVRIPCRRARYAVFCTRMCVLASVLTTKRTPFFTARVMDGGRVAVVVP